MKGSLRGWVRAAPRLIGYALTGASIAYVGWIISNQFQNIAAQKFSPEFWSALGIAIVVSAVGHLLLASGWGLLLGGLVNAPISWRDVLRIHGRSQIAKYLPGNVFHYAGRQLLGHAVGWSQLGIAAASIIEALLCASIALLVVVSSPAESLSAFLKLPTYLAIAIAVLVPMGIWLTCYAAILPPALARHIPPTKLRAIAIGGRLPGAFAAYALYLVVGAIACALIATSLSSPPLWSSPMLAVGGAYIAAWLIGYVSPGASGGLGVREAAFITLVAPALGEETALLTALATRLATIAGDAIAFAVALTLRPPYQR